MTEEQQARRAEPPGKIAPAAEDAPPEPAKNSVTPTEVVCEILGHADRAKNEPRNKNSKISISLL